MAKVLLSDNDEQTLKLLQALMTKEGHHVYIGHTPEITAHLMDTLTYDIFILGLQSNKDGGMHLLEKSLSAHPGTPVILMAAKVDIPTALRALKRGAYDFLVKPIYINDFLSIFSHCVKCLKMKTNMINGNGLYKTNESYRDLIAESDYMKKILKKLPLLVHGNINYLIHGEFGTGRSTIASILSKKEHLKRKSKCITLSCLEYSTNIDEAIIYGGKCNLNALKNQVEGAIANLRPDDVLIIKDAQAMPFEIMDMLLPFIAGDQLSRAWIQQLKSATLPESRIKKTVCQIILITSDISKGHNATNPFLRNFIHLIPHAQLFLPPLRERREAILPLASFFLDRNTSAGMPAFHLSNDLQRILESYTWPGNINELQQAIFFMQTQAYDNMLRPEYLPMLIQVSIGILASETLAESYMRQFKGHAFRAFLERHMNEASKRLKKMKSSTQTSPESI